MNFAERRKQAQSMVVEFLSTFSPPRGLDEDQLATRITQLADAFARRMPVRGDYGEAIRGVLTKVMDTHLSNTWPPQAAFVMAMPNREQAQFAAAETYKPKSEEELAGRLMDDGKPVAESILWGVTSRSLPHEHLDRYRNASVMRWMDTYGHKAPDLMFKQYGGVVMPYFPSEKRSDA